MVFKEIVLVQSFAQQLARVVSTLNITYPYHLQGLEKLRFYYMHYRRSDTVGKLLQKYQGAIPNLNSEYQMTFFLCHI